MSLAESSMGLCEWLQGLHAVVSSDELQLPEWCDKVALGNTAGNQPLHDGETADCNIVMALDRSIVLLIEGKQVDGFSNRSNAFGDSLGATVVNKLSVQAGTGLDETPHASTPSKVVRVAFNLGSQARGGGVTAVAGEVYVAILPSMLTAAFAGAPWAKDAERLLYQAGIAPPVQVLDDGAGAKLKRHIHGFTAACSREWVAALPRLRAEYNAADGDTRDTVAGVVGIIDSVFGSAKVRDALLNPINLARWCFGGFVYTPQALITLSTLSKQGAVKPPHGWRSCRKRPRSG